MKRIGEGLNDLLFAFVAIIFFSIIKFDEGGPLTRISIVAIYILIIMIVVWIF